MIKKNDYYDVEFVDLTHDAMGVCKVKGFPVFVKDALKGEKAKIKITKLNKNFGFGRLIEITEESPFRKLPICEHYQECGGCNMMHMSYEMQLGFKKYRTQQTLQKLGRIEVPVHDTVGMSNPYYYRNKAIIPFGVAYGKMVAGLYKVRSHDIVDIKRCHIFPKVYSEIVRFLKSVFNEFDVPAYDEKTKLGLVRAVMLRNSQKTGEISCVIVTKHPKFHNREQIVDKLVERYPQITSVIHNVNSEETNVVLGAKSKVLYGKDELVDSLMGLEFHISHRSFYQINPIQTELVYNKAIELANLNSDMRVIDAYSGIGTIGLIASKYVKEVIGFDVIKDAVKNAKTNAQINNIKNARFLVGKAEDVMPSLAKEPVDVVFVDPPRKGLDKSFMEAVVAMKVPRIIYISCNVSTLARDLNYFQSQEYKIKEVTPFDMFPQTSHIETVTLLELK